MTRGSDCPSAALGIFGVAGLPDRQSCEMTVLPSRIARAITNGSR